MGSSPAAAALEGATGRIGPRTPRPVVPSAEELERHAVFLKKLKDPLWLQPPFAPPPAAEA